MEDKAAPWSALPLGKIVVAFSLSLAPAITGRYDPTLPETPVWEPTPRITERSTAGSGAPATSYVNPQSRRVSRTEWVGCPPKSDTNPLTKLVHMYYIHPRLARHTPQTQRRNTQPRGNHSPGPHEDSTSKPIPKGGPHAAPRLKQTPPSPHSKGPGSPFPHQPPSDGRSTDYARQAPSCDALPIQRSPSSDAFIPALCAPVSRVGQPTPGLARPSCLVCPAVPAIRLPGGCTGTPVLKVRLRRYLPRQRSGHVPLPVGSAPHNPDHSRQRVGISQTGADGSATTPGLVSSHGPSIACPLPNKQTRNTQLPIEDPPQEDRMNTVPPLPLDQNSQ